MKKISFFLLIIIFFLTTIQITKGQTFDLGFTFQDSVKSAKMDSIYRRAIDLNRPLLFELITTLPNQDQSRDQNTIISDETGGTVGGGGNGTMSLYYNLHPHIPNEFNINTGKTVGEIPIQHQVAANGATTYTVPIECAPGRVGVQPAVALSYNSLGSDGVLGFGWSLGGLSSINRTASNYYYDGSIRPTQMTSSASFYMDGTKIIQTSATTTVRTFAPEQGNIKIEAFMSGAITKYFKVWFSNGSTAIYGYDNNTTTNELSYPLTIMTDVLGNQIKYTYEKVNNHYYIKEIKYGSSKTIINDFASIKFFYKARTDVSGGWDAGIEITENRLLDYIQCINNSTTIKTYNFTYTLNKVNLLTQIDCNLSSGSLNPLKFYYGTNNPQTQFTKSTAQLTSWFSNTTVDNLVVSKGKFDMWSNDDALMSYPALSPYVEFYTPSSLFSHSYRWYENMYHPDQTLLVYPGLDDNIVFAYSGLKADNGFMELTSGDVDGKAGDELIKINNIVSGTSDYLTFTMYKPNGYGGYYTYKTTNYSPMTALDHNGRKSITPKVFTLGDFAGIGKLQVLAVSRYNPIENGNATRIMVFDIDAKTTLYNSTFSGFNFTASNSSSDIIFAMDYDGDGRAEICHIHNNGTDIYAFTGTTNLTLSKIATISDLKRNMTTSRKLMVGDINGDGKTDLLLSPYASYYYSYYTYVPVTNHRYCPNCGIENPGSDYCHNCSAYLPPSIHCYDCGSTLTYGYCNGSYSQCSCPYHGSEVYTYINEFIDNGNQWTVYYSKGSGGFDKKTQALIRHDQIYNGAAAHYILQDVNNNGRTDLVRFYSGNISVYPGLGTGFSTTPEPAYTYASSSAYLIPTVVGTGNYHSQMLALNNGTIDKFSFTRNDTRERMLSGAVNSLGVITKTEYKKIDDNSYPGIYQQGAGAVFPYENLNAYIWATAETQTWYNNVQKACNSYFYTNAIVHRQGLGFRGFTKFSVTDNRYRTVEQTFDPIDKYGALMKVETPVSRSENTYYTTTNYNKTIIVRPTQQKETNLLNNNVITTNYQSYDGYNQPLSIETEYGTGSGVKTKREYVYSNTNISTAYVLGLPTEEKITNTRAGSSWINKTNITYSNYLPATKTTYTGTSGTLQTGYETFGYDTEGNLTNHSSKPYSSANMLSTSYTYDAKKRWIVTVTDPMNLTTTYGYDGFGRLTSDKNFLNQTTTFGYDVLDRQTNITSPDGVTSQTVFAWNSINNGSVMSITATATGRPTGVKYVNAFGSTTRESAVGFNGSNIFTDYEYDQYGRLYRTTDPYTSTKRYTTYEYDSYDRLWRQTTPAGRQTVTTYSGNVVTTVDAGMTTTKTYDVSGALIQASDPAGNTTYTLRPDGQPSSVKTPDNVTTSFGYDTYGRQQSITDPSAGVIQYQYNAEGLLWKQINARNQTTTYTYNNFGQVLTKVVPEQTITYTYDPTYKRLTSVTAGSHYAVAYLYDNLGRISKETETEGSISLIKDYTYDLGRVKTVKYNNVATDVLTYNYNTYGHISVSS